MPKNLLAEIEDDTDHHCKWEGRDFTWAQVFIWTGIITSIASSILATGVFTVEKWVTVIVAALPAAVIVIDKTFKFASRASWHALYRASLNGLRRGLTFEGVPEKEISERRSKLEIEMEKLFPALDSGTIGSKK